MVRHGVLFVRSWSWDYAWTRSFNVEIVHEARSKQSISVRCTFVWMLLHVGLSLLTTRVTTHSLIHRCLTMCTYSGQTFITLPYRVMHRYTVSSWEHIRADNRRYRTLFSWKSLSFKYCYRWCMWLDWRQWTLSPSIKIRILTNATKYAHLFFPEIRLKHFV